MAWPFGGNSPDLYRRDLLTPPEMPDDMAGGMGALAPKPRGGLSRFLGGVAKGIDTVTSNPLYHRLWSGMVSGMTGDPSAGPRALQHLSNVPTIQDELARMRIAALEQREARSADQRKAEEQFSTIAGVSPGSPEAMSAYAKAFPKDYARDVMFPKQVDAPKAPALFKKSLPNNMVQDYFIKPDGTPDYEQPSGAPYSRRNPPAAKEPRVADLDVEGAYALWQASGMKIKDWLNEMSLFGDTAIARAAMRHPEVQRLLRSGESAPASVPTGPMPLPEKQDQLQSGTVYQTKRGLARWNGTTFEKVE